MRFIKRILAVILTVLMLTMNLNVSLAAGDSSRDYVQDFVERLYVNMLGRPSDTVGLNYWTNSIKSGSMTGDDVATRFYKSAEFKRINGQITNEQFIDKMYLVLLNRKCDATGRAYWSNILETKSKTRDQVFDKFLSSDEWRQVCTRYGIQLSKVGADAYVDGLYKNLLNRRAKDSEITYWAQKIRDREMSAIDVTYRLMESADYHARNRSSADFIRDMYMAMFKRSASDSDVNYWTGRMAKGEERVEILNALGVTAEFTDICLNKYKINRGQPIKLRGKYTICIDPGHSAVMPGGTCPLGPGSSIGKPADAVGTHGKASGLMEYELTLMISIKLRDELQRRGYRVVMTRTDSNKAYDLVYRATYGNQNADLMLRIHADGLDNTSVNGCSAIIITKNNKWNPQTYSGSRKLAECLLNSYVPQTGIRNRGVVEEDTMAGNNWSTIPCVLFELGFMTNRTEDLNMANPSFQVNMVKGLADGIDKYYGFM